MAIVTNLDPDRRIEPRGLLLVEEVSIDEEVWKAVEDFLIENEKEEVMNFDSNFRIDPTGKCIVKLVKKAISQSSYWG